MSNSGSGGEGDAKGQPGSFGVAPHRLSLTKAAARADTTLLGLASDDFSDGRGAPYFM